MPRLIESPELFVVLPRNQTISRVGEERPQHQRRVLFGAVESKTNEWSKVQQNVGGKDLDCDGNQVKAAHVLGIDRRTLSRKLKNLRT